MEHMAQLRQIAVGDRNKLLLKIASGRVARKGIATGEIVGRVEAGGFFGRVQKAAIQLGHLFGKLGVAVRLRAQIEMLRAFFFDAYKQDHVAVHAADRFQMRFDDARDGVDALFGFALGTREEVAFARAEAWRTRASEVLESPKNSM